jgi:SAM-dependent methyltransferase
VNENHQRLCPSPGWAEHLHDDVLPSLAALATFGDEMLELGPGPGAATEWLRHRVTRLSAIESDPDAVDALTRRFPGTNVHVELGDATDLGFPAATFDSVGTFTMLHHVPTPIQQHRLLTEAYRVLRPGGVLAGSDSLASNDLHHFHVDDTYNPVDPSALLAWLRAIGFARITLVIDDDLRFVAHKRPDGESGACGRQSGDEQGGP